MYITCSDYSKLGIVFHKFHLAHGAFVGPSTPGGERPDAAAQGALVGAMGPGVGKAAGEPCRSVVGRALELGSIDAHGTLVLASTFGRTLADDAPISGWTGRACGPDVEWAVVAGAMALGSRSQLNREPNGKCCTTGNFDKTSALYILTIP